MYSVYAKPWPHSNLVVADLFMHSLPGIILLYNYLTASFLH